MVMKSWSTLARIMACCLKAPSHNLNQYMDLSSLRSSDNHLRAISKEITRPSVTQICLWLPLTVIRSHVSSQSSCRWRTSLVKPSVKKPRSSWRAWPKWTRRQSLRLRRPSTIRGMSAACYIDGLVQDCSNSSVLALELLQFCTKPSI